MGELTKMLREPSPENVKRKIVNVDPIEKAMWLRYNNTIYKTSETGMQSGPIQVVDGKEACQLVPNWGIRGEIETIIHKLCPTLTGYLPSAVTCYENLQVGVGG